MLPKYHLPFLLRRRNAKMGTKNHRPLLTGGINILYLLIQRIIGGCALSRISFDPVGA
jgi:hypothetical protein